MLGYIQRVFLAVGLDIHRARNRDEQLLCAHLQRFGVGVVVDVGANTGQYGRYLRDRGYRGRIFSIEPLSIAHAKLRATAVRSYLWTVAPAMALGDKEGTVEINVSRNLVSSSVLPMLNGGYMQGRGAKLARKTMYVGTESVPIRRLDHVFAEYSLRQYGPVFLKIDAQGAEGKILEAAHDVLPYVVGLQVEISTTSLYQGQMLADALVHRLYGLGYEIWGIIPGFRDPNNGRLLQFDCIFFKSNAVPAVL